MQTHSSNRCSRPQLQILPKTI